MKTKVILKTALAKKEGIFKVLTNYSKLKCNLLKNQKKIKNKTFVCLHYHGNIFKLCRLSLSPNRTKKIMKKKKKQLLCKSLPNVELEHVVWFISVWQVDSFCSAPYLYVTSVSQRIIVYIYIFWLYCTVKKNNKKTVQQSVHVGLLAGYMEEAANSKFI